MELKLPLSVGTPRASNGPPNDDFKTPQAPRGRRRYWLNAMMNDESELLDNLLEEDDVNEPVKAEWLWWDPINGCTHCDHIKLPPLLLAARWCSPKTVRLLLSKGASPVFIGPDSMTALHALCAQPPCSFGFLEAVRSFYTPIAMKVDQFGSKPSMQKDPFCLGLSRACPDPEPQDEDEESFMGDSQAPNTPQPASGPLSPALAVTRALVRTPRGTPSTSETRNDDVAGSYVALRNREMALVARILIFFGGLDPHTRDAKGHSASDYAEMFGHDLISEVFAETHPQRALSATVHVPPPAAKTTLPPLVCTTPAAHNAQYEESPNSVLASVQSALSCLPTACTLPDESTTRHAMGVKRRGPRLRKFEPVSPPTTRRRLAFRTPQLAPVEN